MPDAQPSKSELPNGMVVSTFNPIGDPLVFIEDATPS